MGSWPAPPAGPADPRHAAVRAGGVRLPHHLHHVAPADVHLAAPVVGPGDAGPALVDERVAHVVGDLVAPELRHAELLPGLEHAVLQEVVEAGVQPLDGECRQRGHHPLRRLHDVAHHLLESAGDAVQLVAHGRRHVEVAAHEVRLPLGGDAETQGRGPHRRPEADRLRAAEAVQELVVGQGRERRGQQRGQGRRCRSFHRVRSFRGSYQCETSHCPRRAQHA